MRYMILTDDQPHDLVEQVEHYMADGWKPLGGVACSASETADYLYTTYAQAMIKNEDE